MGGGPAGRTFVQIWLTDVATYPLFATMAAGLSLLGLRLYHSSTAPEVTFSKSNRADWTTWTEESTKETGEKFRNHPVRKFFGSVKPSIMPGLNESMSRE